MVRDYKEGALVVITEESFQRIYNHAKSIIMYPNDSYLAIAKKMIGVEGRVTKRFTPGYEFNVQWPVPYTSEDGVEYRTTTLQVKDNWVEPLDDNWSEV